MLATPGRGAPAKLSLTSLSQPCLPVSSAGPTRILPFLYLGSQQDAMDLETLQRCGIDYVINLSSNCPKPPFLCDSKFLRIAVNDSYTEKLLPHFETAFEFLDKVRESNACVLVHCLAGISRSPTVAIAYIMRHLHMTSEDAYRYIKDKRPSISPNFNFLGQLLEYEKRLKEFRDQNIHEQLKASLRNVLVQPTRTEGSKTSPCLKLDGERQALTSPPVTYRRSMSTEDLNLCVFKRSMSCPVKIYKTGSFTASDVSAHFHLDGSESPSTEINLNGKRKMQKRTDTQAGDAGSAWSLKSAQPTSLGATAERPRGLGGLGTLKSRKGLNIPNPVQEDLPSPSTELSKLTFTAGSLGSAPSNVVSTVVSPVMSVPTAISECEEGRNCPGGIVPSAPRLTEDTEPMDTEEAFFPQRAEHDSVCAKPSQEVQIGGGVDRSRHSATNPFFANLPNLKKLTGAQESAGTLNRFEGFGTYFQQEEETESEESRTDCVPERARTYPLPELTVSSEFAPEKSRSRALTEPVASEPGSLSIENPMFPGRKQRAHGRKFRFGVHHGKSTPERKGSPTSPNPKRKSSDKTTTPLIQNSASGISQRISRYLRSRVIASTFMLPCTAGVSAAGIGASVAGETSNFSFFTSMPATPKPTSVAATSTTDSGVVRSSTIGGISVIQSEKNAALRNQGPTKSKSESGCLYSMCDDLESPESGFVESPMTDISSSGGNPYGCDPERESISSTSSLEIAVN